MIGDHVLYVRIYSFGSSTFDDFATRRLSADLPASKGIVLDLRENPGGFVDAGRAA